jgi:hypothetical protein
MSSADSPTAPREDNFAIAMNDILSSWDRAAANFWSALDGTYGPKDAAGDVIECSGKALGAMGRVQNPFAPLLLLARLFTAPQSTAAQPSSRVEARIYEKVPRPLTLHTMGFRAIGRGPEFFIHPNNITFEPREIHKDNSRTFRLRVDWRHLPQDARQMTIIYEGEVVSAQTGKLVCDPIRFVKPAYAD